MNLDGQSVDGVGITSNTHTPDSLKPVTVACESIGVTLAPSGRKRRNRRKKRINLMSSIGVVTSKEHSDTPSSLSSDHGSMPNEVFVPAPSVSRVVKRIGTMRKARSKSSSESTENDMIPLDHKEACSIKILPYVSHSDKTDGCQLETLYLKGNNSDFHPCVEDLGNYFGAMGVQIDCRDFGLSCYQIDFYDNMGKMVKWLARRSVLDLTDQNFTICRTPEQLLAAPQPVSTKPVTPTAETKSYKIFKGPRVKQYTHCVQVSGILSSLKSNSDFADQLSLGLTQKLTCMELDASSAVWTAQEDAMLSSVTLRANRSFGVHSYFNVKISFLGVDHYLDVNVTEGICQQISDGEYPDFYVAAPAYNIGEKRMYSKKVKEFFTNLHPKKNVVVMVTSVRINGRKGLTPSLAVYGVNAIPDFVTLGRAHFRTFDKLEDLVAEIRVSKPVKILSYSLSISTTSKSNLVLYKALDHIISSDGGDNLLGHYFDGNKDDPGRYTFLVSSQITASPDFAFQLNTRPSKGSAKKTHVSSSPSRGSQI